MVFTVTRSQPNRIPLGCAGTEDLSLGCAADKSAKSPKSLRNVKGRKKCLGTKAGYMKYCQTVKMWQKDESESFRSNGH